MKCLFSPLLFRKLSKASFAINKKTNTGNDIKMNVQNKHPKSES